MLWICTGCTTAYSVDAPCCPHCGGTEHRLSTDPTPVFSGEPGPEPATLPAGQKVKATDA